jgi:hypothetical protein
VQNRYRQELALPLGERLGILLPSFFSIEPKDTAVKPHPQLLGRRDLSGKAAFSPPRASIMEGIRDPVKLS